MATPTATLSSLLKNATIDDDEQILKAANAELKTSKNNLDVLHVRVVALLNLDRWDDALRSLDEGGDKLAERCKLEKAYALYKTGKLEEAEELAKNGGSRGLTHVAAQVAYRAEKFEDAAKIYKHLSGEETLIDGEDTDLRINSAATDAQLEWQGNGDKVEQSRKKPAREDLEAFETTYNAACGCIARGDLATGSMLLKRARDLCQAHEELSDDEKSAEVLPIMVQQAYVFTKMGKLDEAEALENMINIAAVPEAPTRIIAQNNSLAASTKNDNPYLTERLFSSAPKLSHGEQHFKHQSDILVRNRYAIDLQSLKYSGVAYTSASIISKSQSPNTSPFICNFGVLGAAAAAKCETGKTGLKQILPLLEKRQNDVGLLLVIIQLYVLTNNPGPATQLLEAFFKRLEESKSATDHDVRFAPGLIAVAVSLYRLAGRKGPIKTELGKAASYWRKKSKSSPALLRAAGTSFLESSDPQELKVAGDMFSLLRTNEPNDRTAIAGYVASYAITDFSKVSDELEKLTPVSKLIAGVDAAALEEAGIPSLPVPTQLASKKRPVDSTEKEKEKPAKVRKIRKSHLLKDFEEGKKMDPERWLPLKDRSSYRPKGKKGKKKANDLTQGGVVKEEGERLELAGGAGTVKVEKSAGGGGKGKNKKKGKK